MKLKLAYFGTPDFSARLLEKIITDKDLPVEVNLVITQPDKPVGRKKILTSSPVKQVSEKYHIKTLTHLSVVSSHLSDVDLALLYAFGQIIPAELLKLPKYGFWNIHPSLLPKYRGASPMAYPLIIGDDKTGVTLIQMDEQMDHGPIIAQEEYKILPTDKRPDLETKLTNLGFELFKKSIQQPISTNFNPSTSLRASQFKLITQDERLASFTRRLTRADGFIPHSALKKALNNEPLTFDELPELIKDYYQHNKQLISTNFNQFQPISSAKQIYNLFRALFPWPGLWTKIMINGQEKRLKITDLSLDVLQATRFALHIKNVQLEGKKDVTYDQFRKQYIDL